MLKDFDLELSHLEGQRPKMKRLCIFATRSCMKMNISKRYSTMSPRRFLAISRNEVKIYAMLAWHRTTLWLALRSASSIADHKAFSSRRFDMYERPVEETKEVSRANRVCPVRFWQSWGWPSGRHVALILIMLWEPCGWHSGQFPPPP